MGVLTAEDEEAVDDELAEIIKQSLPDVPPPVQEEEEEDVQLPSAPSEEPSVADEPAKKAKVKKEAELVPA